MNWEIIISAIGLISGGAGLLFYKEKKRSEQLKNESSSADEWRKLYERRDQDARDLDAKVDRLYSELSRYRDDNNNLTTDIAILRMQKCEINGCSHRTPPRNY